MSEKKTNQDMNIQGHLSELRTRLTWSLVIFILCFGGCFYYSEDIYSFLVKPLAMIYENQSGKRLIYTGLTEAFFTYMKVAFYAGLFVSFPFIAAQCYIFVAPGLYKNEKKILLPFLIATPVLFFAGGALVYYVIFPLAWKFFVSFETLGGQGDLPIMLEAKVSEYLSLVINLILAFGIAFQMPILLTLLARVGLITSDMLVKNRRYSIVIILLVAAFLTPPDIMSQIGLALPMMLLYEISIFSCRMVAKQRK
jgi:sec-independent protein translocase protein TatC